MPESAAGEKQRTVPDDSAALSGAVPPEQQGDAGIVDGVACFNDRVYSPQHYDLAREVGDSVIRRADGLFGYQLVVVVDDLDMGVDDIVRGRDLLRSTALQCGFASVCWLAALSRNAATRKSLSPSTPSMRTCRLSTMRPAGV